MNTCSIANSHIWISTNSNLLWKKSSLLATSDVRSRIITPRNEQTKSREPSREDQQGRNESIYHALYIVSVLESEFTACECNIQPETIKEKKPKGGYTSWGLEPPTFSIAKQLQKLTTRRAVTKPLPIGGPARPRAGQPPPRGFWINPVGEYPLDQSRHMKIMKFCQEYMPPFYPPFPMRDLTTTSIIPRSRLPPSKTTVRWHLCHDHCIVGLEYR